MSEVRLSDVEVQIIVQAAQDIVGSSLDGVKLYGSRTDLTKNGGDIDLLIECIGPLQDKWATAQLLRQAICARLGQQKIDIFIVSTDPQANTQREETFLQLIREQAKLLWSSRGKSSCDSA